MHVLFEVVLVAGAKAEPLLTQETLDDTQARIMTRAELEAEGFTGIQDDFEARERRFIVVRRRDQNRIANWLDTHQGVAGYRPHDFDL